MILSSGCTANPHSLMPVVDHATMNEHERGDTCFGYAPERST
jgi:hypothetical protein